MYTNDKIGLKNPTITGNFVPNGGQNGLPINDKREPLAPSCAIIGSSLELRVKTHFVGLSVGAHFS
jgi:hypothetical protein